MQLLWPVIVQDRMDSYPNRQIATAASTAREVVSPSAEEVCWYAAWTRSRHEKQVHLQLMQRGIESFLPTYASRRVWKDRKVTLEMPLFPGYIFVKIPYRERLRVLQLAGVAKFVTFGGVPAPLPTSDIEALRCGIDSRVPMEPHPFLKVGTRVRLTAGPFAGCTGVLVRKKQSWRFVLSLDLLNRGVAVEVDAAEVEPLR